jgi:hypothetical protein
MASALVALASLCVCVLGVVLVATRLAPCLAPVCLDRSPVLLWWMVVGCSWARGVGGWERKRSGDGPRPRAPGWPVCCPLLRVPSLLRGLTRQVPRLGHRHESLDTQSLFGAGGLGGPPSLRFGHEG